MITNDKPKNIDFGLPVVYDGNRNHILFSDNSVEYPAGGIIAEYMRLLPVEIKPVIIDCCNLNEEASPDNLALFLDDFQKKMTERFPPVISRMVTLEIFNVIDEWFEAERSGRSDEYVETIKKVACYNDVNRHIFSDTAFAGLGKETVCQMALSAYASFATTYINTKYIFNHIIKFAENEEDVDEKAIQLISNLYTEMIDMQHIDFRIINTEKGFESLYTIKSSMSLLTFEFAHWLNKDVPFVKCSNCGHYFIPVGRKDQIYCTYPSLQNKDRTCREIGAQVTRANKEKTDVITREYRKVYMRYKMFTKRHPGNKDAAKQFDALTKGMREWRKKLSNGSSTTDQCLEWIGQF